MAGDSARDVARRQREKAARLERSAQMWERGADGEAATALALDALKAHGWTTFHDVRWPGRQRANIDHIAVGPGGVFVIDSKNWSGDLRVDGHVLYQGSHHREREVAAAADAALAVTQLLQGLPATPVLCFVRPESMDGWVRDVMICSTANLAAMLVGRPPVLGPESIRRVITILQWQLTSASHPLPGRSARQRRAARNVSRVQPPPPRLAAPRRNVLPRVLGLGCAGVLGLLGLMIVVAVGISVVGGIGHVVRAGAHQRAGRGTDGSAVPVLGDTVRLPASTTHPAVQLRADKVTRLAYNGPAYGLSEGRHLVGVHYSIRNEGTRMWGAGPPYLRFSALASDGQPAQPGNYAALPARRILPAAFNLKAGATRQGYVVVSVADGAKLVRVSVDLGYGDGDRGEWLIP